MLGRLAELALSGNSSSESSGGQALIPKKRRFEGGRPRTTDSR
jgi:hypothetical protein